MTSASPPGGNLPGVVLSFGLAMMLRILPVPPAWFDLTPDWIALLLLYWTLTAPDRVGVLTAWFVGLAADALTGRILGQHALAYTVMAYLNLRLRDHILAVPLPVQSLWVLLSLLLAQLLIFWTQRIDLAEPPRLAYWLPALTGACAWPLLRAVLPARRAEVRPP